MDAKDDKLSQIANACSPATFGMEQQDVLDETYSTSGILRIIEQLILKGKNDGRVVKADLYKLNVYGPGPFFTAHVYTPRGESMFGSLVVVLPTKHEGVSLLFRYQGDKEYAFDTASAVKSKETPHATFYSDVEHEVLPVTCGYRVALTYNLHFVVSSPDPLVSLGAHAEDQNGNLDEIKSSISQLLDEPSLLPKGGYIAFRLLHKYPCKTSSKMLLSDVNKLLKGSDASLNKHGRSFL